MKLIQALALSAGAAFAATAASARTAADTIVSTPAYYWAGDTIFQGSFKAWAVSPYEIRSTYHGRPHYFMPVSQTWTRKNDLSAYPALTTDNTLHRAIFNMGLDEMVNAVEPDTTLRTGKEWAGVWTRDVSYSIILSMAALQPQAAMTSLMRKVNADGQIIQDTGSGGAWPISTDRMIWVVAAWEVYKTTGSEAWLRKVYPVALRSLQKDSLTIFSDRGLVKGETSFIDWREQSHPRWMQTVDISQSEALSTNVMYVMALRSTAQMARLLGHKAEAATLDGRAERLAAAINNTFWMPDKGYYAMYAYGRDSKILNPRAETLGLALSILGDVAPAERQKSISSHNPLTPYGPAIFYPQISDMPSYHNNALWPFVGSYWGLAQAKAGNEPGVMQAIGAVFRPAALFTTNKENFNLDNGDYFTELNSSNMLWSLSGNLALTMRILFGIDYQADGILIKPFVPKAFEGTRTLDNIAYRGGRLSVTVNGYGDRVASMTLNGKAIDPGKVIPAKKLKGDNRIVVQMDNQPIEAMTVNSVPNLKAPLTPITWIEDGRLNWNPIEYIGEYIVLRNGAEAGRTHMTSWPVDGQGAEWQVIGVADDGTQGFASEPRSTRPRTVAQMDNEGTAMTSAEVSYPAKAPIAGYEGGFAETSTTTAPVTATVTVPTDGSYTLGFRYANGNGPVNTENKAAIRTLYVDGQAAGTVVLPHRGVANWDDWGMTNLIPVTLTAGQHKVELRFLPQDRNMNLKTNHALIDCVVVEKR